ncbi:hypothetical protein FOCC_FOCC015303 [Frankliniella occidentalis]|nr:hypothetical protein FOCC_FOCC015303 [Frankliniella occidentalis]
MPKNEEIPLRLWIKFDEEHVGIQARKKHKNLMTGKQIPQSWTPIYPIKVKIKPRKNCSLRNDETVTLRSIFKSNN